LFCNTHKCALSLKFSMNLYVTKFLEQFHLLCYRRVHHHLKRGSSSFAEWQGSCLKNFVPFNWPTHELMFIEYCLLFPQLLELYASTSCRNSYVYTYVTRTYMILYLYPNRTRHTHHGRFLLICAQSIRAQQHLSIFPMVAVVHMNCSMTYMHQHSNIPLPFYITVVFSQLACKGTPFLLVLCNNQDMIDHQTSTHGPERLDLPCFSDPGCRHSMIHVLQLTIDSRAFYCVPL
jgi:hypothetical protein